MKYLILVVAFAGCLTTPAEIVTNDDVEQTAKQFAFSGATMAVFQVESTCQVNWFIETKGGSPYGVILVETDGAYAWEMIHQSGPSNNMVGVYTETSGANVPGVLFHAAPFDGTASLFFRADGDMMVEHECDANVTLIEQKPLLTFLDHTRAPQLETAGIQSAPIQWDVQGNEFVFAASEEDLQAGGSEFALDVGGNQLISAQLTSAPIRGNLETNLATGIWSGSDGGFWLASY